MADISKIKLAGEQSARNVKDITARNHIANKSNPHSVTKTQVGLGNVTNDKQVKGLASGTTSGHIVVFGNNGYTVADGGKSVQDIVDIAEGKTKTIITNGTQMPTLKVQTASVTVTSLKDKDGNTVALNTLKLGDNVLLVDLEYPDRWVSTITTSGTTVQSVTLSVLETQKVDLSSYQPLIDTNNKLSADLVDDTNTTNKFVTSTEKSTWNGKQNAITSTNKLNASLVSGLATVATTGAYSDLSGAPTVNNGKFTITVTKDGTATAKEFTANQSTNTSISISFTTETWSFEVEGEANPVSKTVITGITIS